MKILKKIILSAAFASLASLAFSLETGGLVSNDSTFKNRKKDGDLKLLQKNGVNLWLRTPVSEDGQSYFATEGEFRTEYDFNIADSDKKLTLAGDLALFKLVIKRELDAGDFQLSAGRFFNSDLSGLVYTQNGDGAKFELNSSRFKVAAFGAYTGLLNAKNITIIEDALDSSDLPDLSEKKKLYVLTNKYLVGAATFTLPNIFARQTVAVEGFGTMTLESKKYNRFYGTIALNGPIVSPVFYNVSSTLGFSKYDTNKMTKGHLTRGSIIAYPSFKSMSISLNGLYASGGTDTDKTFTAFQGFTSGTADQSLAEPEYSGIATFGLAATIKPLPNLLCDANADFVFDTQAGDKNDEFKNKGFQYSAGLTFQVVSDVQIGASFGQFVGTKDYEEQNKTQLKIKATIAF